MPEQTLDKDTIIAYHAYLQNKVHNELNATGLGPARFPYKLFQILGTFAVLSGVTGTLIITLRHRHVYLVDWWHAFLGPFFLILALVLASLSMYMAVIARRRSNAYRRELFFRPIGDYGVAVVHKSTLVHEEEHKSDLKSGTAPHRTVKPNTDDYASTDLHKHRRERQAHENRAYNDNGYDDKHHGDRDRRHHHGDRDRRHHDGQRRHDDRDRDRRRHDDPEREQRRRDDREHRRPDDRREKRSNIPRDEKDDRRERKAREAGEKHRPRAGEEERARDGEEDRPTNASRGGRRAVRGAPIISVTESSQRSQIVLDPDFGKVADQGHGESEL